MSIKGLEVSEAAAAKLNSTLKRSLNAQKKLLKEEIDKIQYLLDNKDALTAWRNSQAGGTRIANILNSLNETERLYIEAGDSTAAKIFRARMEKQLTTQLTNLKANELEVIIKAKQYNITARQNILKGLNEINREAVATEMFAQARRTGGFLSNFGRPFMKDLITFETKAAGSKTLGEYMTNLFNTYETALKDVYVKGIIRGDNYQTMIRGLTQATNITARKAELLIVTEANAIFNDGVRKVIKDNPLVKGYRFRATLDSRTSDICQKWDGKYIPKEDVQPGVNYPPLHPRCRSTVTTVLASESSIQDTTQRYTKNGSNEWVPVPPGMTYAQFKQNFNFPPNPQKLAEYRRNNP